MFVAWPSPPELFFTSDGGLTFSTVETPNSTSEETISRAITMATKDNCEFVITLCKVAATPATPRTSPLMQTSPLVSSALMAEKDWLEYQSTEAGAGLSQTPATRKCCVVARVKPRDVTFFVYNLLGSKRQQLEEITAGFVSSHRSTLSILEAMLFQKLGLFHAIKPDLKTIDAVEGLLSDAQQYPKQQQIALSSPPGGSLSPSHLRDRISVSTEPVVVTPGSGGALRIQRSHS
jgi:hypothetical protein